jgi:hypothetical protein
MTKIKGSYNQVLAQNEPLVTGLRAVTQSVNLNPMHKRQLELLIEVRTITVSETLEILMSLVCGSDVRLL